LSHDGLMINLALDKRGPGEVGEVLELSEIEEILRLLCRKYGNLEEALANFPITGVDPHLIAQASEQVNFEINSRISCGGMLDHTDPTNVRKIEQGTGPEIPTALELSEVIDILEMKMRMHRDLDEAVAHFPLKNIDPELLNQARAAIADSFSCGGLTRPTDKEINFYPKNGLR
jgi:hypothetical protein